VLAGGRSKRLGRDKAFLTVEGQPLVARTVHKVADLSDDLIVVVDELSRYEPLHLKTRLVPDARPGEGPLMGIYSGLTAAHHDQALVVACDMPFLNLSLLHYMVPLSKGHDIVIPRLDGLLEPLHCIYGKGCLPHMARLLDRGQRQVIAFFDRVRVRYVEKSEVDRFDPEHLSFFNVNNPQDWARVRDLLGERGDT
jgi:molybdopterin-guanine dinucleotide biosynthesis protein A